MMSHDVICMSEFVLFNNIIIYVVLLAKQRNCCSPLLYGLKKQKTHNFSYEFAQRQNLVLDDYGVSFVIKHYYLASIRRLLKHIDDEI